MVSKLDKRFRYALEVRESTWFNEKVYDFLKDNDMSLVWSVRDELKTPTVITSDQIYIRFIGDRSINEKDFGKIVKDRDKEMTEYVKRINSIQNEHDILVAFNNHYAGFGPQSANDFLKLMDKPEVNWKDELKQQHQNTLNFITNKSQMSISDFTGFPDVLK